jgi:hypothetical protein
MRIYMTIPSQAKSVDIMSSQAEGVTTIPKGSTDKCLEAHSPQ